jgi:nitroreductase
MFLFLSYQAFTQELKPIQLPAPETKIGKPLMECLQLRQSSRNFASTPLPVQELSNILWAAAGINRPENGKRTVPSAMDRQEVDIYVFLPEGTFLYDAKSHALQSIAAKDLREITGKQPFVKNAPLNLLYVADEKKMKGGTEIQKAQWSSACAGCMLQDVYLYCASQGLAAVVRASFDGDALTKELKLRPEQKIILAQTVGLTELRMKN